MSEIVNTKKLLLKFTWNVATMSWDIQEFQRYLISEINWKKGTKNPVQQLIQGKFLVLVVSSCFT